MTLPRSKIHVTSKSPVGDISVVTLIRTDTTLDHSQKAEKVWFAVLFLVSLLLDDILDITCVAEISSENSQKLAFVLLVTARTLVTADRNYAVGPVTQEGPPRALQTSECRELLNPTRASCLILAQRQPGKLKTA